MLQRILAHLMRETFDTKLAKFLRKQRGEMTYDKFARKLGIKKSSLYRIENGQQSITLRMLQQIADRLNVNSTDMFESTDR
jgi:transcriptional regulator with XRE-family HTH domain